KSRTKCSRPRLHHIRDARLGICVPAFPSDHTKHNVSVVHHNAQILVWPAPAFHIFEMLAKRASRNVPLEHLLQPRFPGLRSFDLPTGREPIGLPGRVSVDFLETHAFKPPGGSCTEIALKVGAIDDNGLILSQRSC